MESWLALVVGAGRAGRKAVGFGGRSDGPNSSLGTVKSGVASCFGFAAFVAMLQIGLASWLAPEHDMLATAQPLAQRVGRL